MLSRHRNVFGAVDFESTGKTRSFQIPNCNKAYVGSVCPTIQYQGREMSWMRHTAELLPKGVLLLCLSLSRRLTSTVTPSILVPRVFHAFAAFHLTFTVIVNT